MNPIKNAGSSNGARKIFLAASALSVFFSLAPDVFAQGFVPLAEIPGLTSREVTSVVNADSLALFFNNLYKYAIGFAAALAVIEIIWGGLEISTKDSVSKNKDGKDRIQNAVFGLVLVLAPALVFSIINPAILNLSLNLPPLQTTTGSTVGTGGAGGRQPTTSVDSATQCSVTGTAGVLQIAICPSDTAAMTWGQTCTSGNLSGVTRTETTDPANGVPVSTSVITCTGNRRYVFIDPGGTFTSISTAINRLRPLVSIPDRQSNGSDAVSFAGICTGAGIGWKVCLSDAPLLTRAVPCQLTGASAQTTWKCYSEALSCINLTNPIDRGLCTSSNPGWTPFQ